MELHDDDKPVGRLLSRRELIKMFGSAGVLLIGGTGWIKSVSAQDATAEATTTATTCVVKPAETEGPYFVEEMLKRFDIRVDPVDGVTVKDGVPLHLKLRVMQLSSDTCTPLTGAQVDIWHCDALGTYSDVNDPGFQTTGQKWLRGYQVTNDKGEVDFLTIYPGWYSGRTVHIHFKIRTDPKSETGYEFTSQLFFDDALSAQLFTQQPYASNPKGTTPDTPNASDSIYDDQLLLTVSESSAADLAAAFSGMGGANAAEATAEATPEATAEPVTRDGYTAIFDIALDLDNPQTSVGPNNGGGGPGGAPPAGGPPSGSPSESTPEATPSS